MPEPRDPRTDVTSRGNLPTTVSAYAIDDFDSPVSSSAPQKLSESNQDLPKDAIYIRSEKHMSAEKAKREVRDAVAKRAKVDRTAKTGGDDNIAERIAKLEAASRLPEDQQRPVNFRDAVGRKFSFPFHLCKTWSVSLPNTFKPQFLPLE